MRYLKTIVLILGLSPVGFIVSLLAFYFHACRELGYAPSYDDPDPAAVPGYKAYAAIINPACDFWIIAFLPWLAAAVSYSILNRKSRRGWVIVKIGVVIQMIGLLLLLGGIFEWYVD